MISFCIHPLFILKTDVTTSGLMQFLGKFVLVVRTNKGPVTFEDIRIYGAPPSTTVSILVLLQSGRNHYLFKDEAFV